jgi:hypothetical protein
MSYKYSLLFGSLALGAVQTFGCSSEFRTCDQRRTCPAGGVGGKAGADGGGAGGKTAGAGKGGSGGNLADDGEAGEAGTADSAGGEGGTTDSGGSGGMAGDSSVEMELEIAQPTLAVGKTYVPYNGKISASGAAQYSWSVTSGALPAGLALQGAQSATVTVAGTPSEAGQFPITLSVTDGTEKKSVDVSLVITHAALFLSDRRVAGVNELFLAEIGGPSTDAPVQLSASLPAGGSVSNYVWSPDGTKVLYLATQSSGGPTELWIASLAAPGIAQRVSGVGVPVNRMVWLRSGNVAAYLTSVGDAYLADLSGATPGPSKLAISGHGDPGYLVASPNGTSLAVVIGNEALHLAETSYVKWASGGPTVTPLLSAQGGLDSFSYDGRYVVLSQGPFAWWLDLSLATPITHEISSSNGVGISWSPNSQALFMSTGAGPLNVFSRGDFTGTDLKTTTLTSVSNCGGGPVRWSPDGRSGLFGCTTDIRGISNLATATPGADFSLLPSGFLPNSFTSLWNVAWSPDSAWIALSIDREIDQQNDLYLVRWAAPGVAYKAHANSINQGVTSYAFSGNSRSVAAVATIGPQANAGLYLTKLPASGPPPLAALVSTPPVAVVQNDINWLPGSRSLAYRAAFSGSTQLFAIPVAADGTAGPPVPISGASGSGVTSYQLAPAR